MNDQTAPVEYREIDGKRVPVRTAEMNSQSVELTKLGDIAEVKVGLQTGDNDAYLFQNPEARGNYRSIEDYREYLLTEDDLHQIRSKERLRLAVIEKGISKDDPDSERYFGGRYIVPYDKGGESDAVGGWMPNYWVPTNYFIDWSEWALKRLKTFTIGDRDGHERRQLCSVIRNSNSYFKRALTFSSRGVYAPTFRFNAGSVYDKESSGIFTVNDSAVVLEILPSRMVRYLLKSVIQSTVSMDVDALKELAVIDKFRSQKKLLTAVINKQKTNPPLRLRQQRATGDRPFGLRSLRPERRRHPGGGKLVCPPLPGPRRRPTRQPRTQTGNGGRVIGSNYYETLQA
ncbi:MAG: hypothetical protein GVY36_18440 [Verrucomicrobia bacterium]|jgi:hypothetical protein|nr:hypothetical protein [Verrucomicrobiota bacterium]